MLNKTHKFCFRCSELKPVCEFYRDTSRRDGLTRLCKKCWQESRLGAVGKHYTGLHKRPFPLDSKCEICRLDFGKQYDYHHFDNDNPSLGLWVCPACDYLAEGIDEIDRNPWKVDTYHKLKKEVEEVEQTFTYLGPFKPPGGTHRLFLDSKQTHKWCPRCGEMKLVEEFNKNRSSFDGLHGWCRECIRSCQVRPGNGEVFCGLHKRPKPAHCELCNGKTFLAYHHWDDGNKSKGIWVCAMNRNRCHHLAEAVDKLDSGNPLPHKYLE